MIHFKTSKTHSSRFFVSFFLMTKKTIRNPSGTSLVRRFQAWKGLDDLATFADRWASEPTWEEPFSGQFRTTSAEVTPNGGLVRESPPKWP